ncbi:LAMI_0H03378g1_1 [Lachancea mirantina]|uniref:dolichyl-phosphate-mannose--protein mannosyltransferase n=1 Tax=Lachancea mirantina TaxID=1230905 RepID=A0A1G4KEK8_9SACH|nr:LAMI_0H03378g1_1 [Lachancea mirantina]
MSIIAEEKRPFKRFVPSDIILRSTSGSLNLLDGILALGLSVWQFWWRTQKWSILDDVLDSELELLQAIEHFATRRFNLLPFPPLLVLFLGVWADKETGEVSLSSMRLFSVASWSLALSLIYLALRKASISQTIALMVSIGFSFHPLYRDAETAELTPESFGLFLFTASLLAWYSLKSSALLSKQWHRYNAMLGLSIGLLAGVKFFGWATLVWLILLTGKEVWKLIGDLKVTSRKIVLTMAVRFGFLIGIPAAILLTSYGTFLEHSSLRTSEYSTYMSPYFKSQLLPEELPQPNAVYYGSRVLIRHSESLGGYLHSHNYTYQSGSHEQQVTLFDQANDSDNEWIIEPQSKELDFKKEPVIVKNNDFILLRHRVTGKLLRASSAKPPVSEQDYDSEVSCTGDQNYTGDSDEMWRLKFIRGTSKFVDVLSPNLIEFQLANKGQGCTLIGHDLRLPDWGFEQQEVLCLDSADLGKSLFYIERSNLYLERGAYMTFPKLSVWKRLTKMANEYVAKQVKYDYYVRHRKQEGDIPVESWLLHGFDSTIKNILFVLPLVSTIMFLAMEFRAWITWNPWAPTATTETSLNHIYKDHTLEALAGWMVHYYAFLHCKHRDLRFVQYLPCYLLSLFSTAQTLNLLWVYSTKSKVFLTIMTALVYMCCAM